MNTAFTTADQAALPCRLTLPDNTRLTNEIITLTYTAGCSASTTGPSLGSTVAATFTAKLAGTLPALEGAHVTLEVQTEEDTWTPLGKFRFETPETGEGVTTVTAVDAMLWVLEQGYYPSDPAPTTAFGVLRDVCSQVGIELGGVTGARNLVQGTENWADCAFYINAATDYGPPAGSIADGVLTVPKGNPRVDTANIPVTPGKSYTVGVDIRSDTAYTGNTVLLQYYDAAGTRQSYAYVPAAVSTAWARITKTFVPPAGTASVRIGLRANAGYDNSYRLLQLELGTAATGWTPSPEDIDIPITGSLEGYTMREMAGYMAALLGRNAMFGPDGKLELRWYSQSGSSICPDVYYSGGFTRKDYDWTVSGLTCSTGPNEEDTLSAGNPGSVIALANPYMTQARLNTLWTELEGFSYRPGEVTMLGDLRLEPGDLVAVTDRSGSSYTLAVMAVEHSYDGGWKTKITAYGSAESDTGASYKGPTTVAMERYAADMASFKKLFADEAYLNELFVRGGIIANDINAVEISASKYLTGVTIVGDVIQANTLSADKLLLRGEDGLLYELNAQAGSLTAQQLEEDQYRNALDGSVLVASSITADKINVTDLFAQDITATGTIRGVTLEGATGNFTGQLNANSGNVGSFIIMDGTLYSSAEHTVTGGSAVTVFTLNGNPALGEAGDGPPEIRFTGAYQGMPRSAAAWITVAGGAENSNGVTSFDHLELGAASGTQSGKLEVSSNGVHTNGNLSTDGNGVFSGNIYTNRYFSFSGAYDSRDFTIFGRWADGKDHNLIQRYTDGLTMGVGWDGTAGYATVLNLRSRTVKVTNSSGTSTLSDERMKKDWKNLEGYDAFFDALNPQAFRYIDGASGRYHLGFGAQSVEQALADSGLDNMDFGGLVHYPLAPEEENSQGLSEEYSLIYTEFVALLTDQVQKLKKKVEALEQRLEALEQTAT